MASHAPDEASPLLAETSANPLRVHDATNQAYDNAQTSLSLRIAAIMFSFAIIGLFTSSIGVMLPPILHHYDLSYLRVSLIFLVGPIGYVFAAQSNALIHARFGQIGVAILGPIFHVISALVISLHPPYPVMLVAFAFSAVGTGLLDGSWCAWAGSMRNANTVSGMLHGSFSVGAAVGPFLAATLAGMKWYQWYYILAGASLVELVLLTLAFRYEDASRYAEDKPTEAEGPHQNTNAIYRHRATWVSAAYFLAYVGTETTISGWIVFFMTHRHRSGSYNARLFSTGFWSGMAIGRLALGTIADRIGVAKATLIYIFCAIGMETLLAVVRIPVVSIVSMSLLGFFMGPMFPSGIVVLTKILPKNLHVAAVSFVASIGQVGAALVPYATGAIVDHFSIDAFRFVIIISTALTLILWISFTSLQHRTPATVQEEHDDA